MWILCHLEIKGNEIADNHAPFIKKKHKSSIIKITK